MGYSGVFTVGRAEMAPTSPGLVTEIQDDVLREQTNWWGNLQPLFWSQIQYGRKQYDIV